MGLDVGIKHDRTVGAVCHAEPAPDGGTRVVLDEMAVWAPDKGSAVAFAAIESWVRAAHRRWGHPEVLFDPWQSLDLAQRLQNSDVALTEYTFNQASVGRLASTLYGLIRSHTLVLPDDAALIDELANVRLKETSPGVYRMDHDPGRHDDRAVALGLCALALMENAGDGSEVWAMGESPWRSELVKAEFVQSLHLGTSW